MACQKGLSAWLFWACLVTLYQGKFFWQWKILNLRNLNNYFSNFYFLFYDQISLIISFTSLKYLLRNLIRLAIYYACSCNIPFFYEPIPKFEKYPSPYVIMGGGIWNIKIIKFAVTWHPLFNSTPWKGPHVLCYFLTQPKHVP